MLDAMRVVIVEIAKKTAKSFSKYNNLCYNEEKDADNKMPICASLYKCRTDVFKLNPI